MSESIVDIIDIFNFIKYKTDTILEIRDYIIESKLKNESSKYKKTIIVKKY